MPTKLETMAEVWESFQKAAYPHWSILDRSQKDQVRAAFCSGWVAMYCLCKSLSTEEITQEEALRHFEILDKELLVYLEETKRKCQEAISRLLLSHGENN